MGNLTYNIKPHDWHTVQVAIQNLANKLGPTASPTMLSITISSTATVSAIVATTAKISSAAIDSAAFIGLTANSATLTSLAFQSALGSTMVASVISIETLNATVGTITAFSCQSATISSLVGTVVSAGTFTASTGTITSLACQSASISALTITSAIISSTILSSAHITNLSCISATISSLVVNSAAISAFTVGSCYQEPCVVNIGGEPSAAWPYAQVYIAGNSNAANKGASFTYHSKFQPVNSETPAWYFGAGEGGVVQNDNFRIVGILSATVHNDVINLNPFAANRSFCIDSVGMISIGQATITNFACVSAKISVGVFATISVGTLTASSAKVISLGAISGLISSFGAQSAIISSVSFKSAIISSLFVTATSGISHGDLSNLHQSVITTASPIFAGEIFTSITALPSTIVQNKIISFRNTTENALYFGKWTASSTATDAVAQWKMNDNAADKVVVENIAGKNGASQQNTNAITTAGKINTALSFDRVNDWIRVTDDDVLDVNTGDFSISIWLKTSNTANQMRIIDKLDSGTPNIGWDVCFVGTNTYPYVTIWDASGSAGGYLTTVPNMRDNAWHHLVLTFDRDGNVTPYLDGVVYTGIAISARQGTLNNAQDLGIGIAKNWSSDKFAGIMDDIRLYKRLLTVQEIINLYNYGSGTEGGEMPEWKKLAEV